jgi:hypothetical protein
MRRLRPALAVPIALLAAGCGTAPPAPAPTAGALAFSSCMRGHGIPGYPDPAGNGAVPKVSPQQAGVTAARFQDGRTACAHLLPNGGGGPTEAELQQSWSDFRAFARCMRTRGVAGWPDPTRYPPHPERPVFDLQDAGIDPHAPRLVAGEHACLPTLHGVNPQRLG